MRLLKETPWLKVWETRAGPYLDSKLRWGGAAADAKAFLGDWNAPRAAGRAELEAAFAFWPYELTGDVDAILTHVAASDAPLAARMRASLFTIDSDPPESLSAFLDELAEHFGGNIPSMRFLGENPFYSVQISEIGLHFDSKIGSMPEMPSADQLRAVIKTIPAGELLYRRAAALIAENAWLMHPQPGEQALPGFM